MEKLTKVLILLTLFTIAFSFPTFFEGLEKLKEKKEALKEHLGLDNLGLFEHKDISLKDLAHFEAPDIKSKLEKFKHIIPKDLDPSHHKEIGEFWTGAFEAFRLPKPYDLINCFGTVSGHTYFRKIQTVADLLHHSKTHDNLKLHIDYAQLEVLMHSLEQAMSCLVQTKDFESFMDALNIAHDPQILKKAGYLYFQARFDILADPFRAVVDEIDNGNFNKAGKNYGEIFKKSAKDFKSQGEDLLVYKAFSNGIAESLALPLPSHFIACYGQKEAKIVMDFFRGFSHAVTEGRWHKADESAADYWEKEGKALLEKISSKVWNCDMNSIDTKQLGEKIGIDLNSQEFKDKMWNYINDHSIMFYSYLRTMNFAFEKNDYLHAGSAYAHLLEAVGKSSK